jgi:hypothetical protein
VRYLWSREFSLSVYLVVDELIDGHSRVPCWAVGQNPAAANPIRSACIVIGPDKPYDLVAKAIKPIIDAFQHLYNRHRPNGTVGGLAPAQYLAALKAKDTSLLKGARRYSAYSSRC